jgi:hypothetical protein
MTQARACKNIRIFSQSFGREQAKSGDVQRLLTELHLLNNVNISERSAVFGRAIAYSTSF